jgi:hypothetical protein
MFLVVPITAALIGLSVYLLRSTNKDQSTKTQITNVIKGVFGILGVVWMVVNIFLGLTGTAWSRFLENKYVVAFLGEIDIKTADFPAWVTILVAGGLLFLAIKISAENNVKGVGKKIWDVIVTYGLLLVILGLLMPILFEAVRLVTQSLLNNEALQSLLKELGILE